MSHDTHTFLNHRSNINHNKAVNHKAPVVIKCLCLLSALVKHLPGANSSVAIATDPQVDAKLEDGAAWEVPH